MNLQSNIININIDITWEVKKHRRKRINRTRDYR